MGEPAKKVESERGGPYSVRQRTPGRHLRTGYVALGLVFVGLGVVGAVLPVMPSTIFFLGALFFFERSSPDLEQRLLQNRFVGESLRNWRQGGKITRQGKRRAVVAIWLCLLVSALFVGPILRSVLLVVGVCLSVFLMRRPEP